MRDAAAYAYLSKREVPVKGAKRNTRVQDPNNRTANTEPELNLLTSDLQVSWAKVSWS